ncbi:hypothetical protein IP84_14960 [beta proteobacterium AAP99]|nr:hypothetical protein IP84_14960 [beta proteobacterium AAP99]
MAWRLARYLPPVADLASVFQAAEQWTVQSTLRSFMSAFTWNYRQSIFQLQCYSLETRYGRAGPFFQYAYAGRPMQPLTGWMDLEAPRFAAIR